MKFMMGVVLYNPKDSNFLSIKTVSESGVFDVVFIQDNSSESASERLKKELKCTLVSEESVVFGDTKNHKNSETSEESNAVVYKFRGSNDGLSKPYNEMIEYSIRNSVDFLCIMDQDSEYGIEEIQKMKNFITANTEILSYTAVIAPRSYAATSKKVERGERLTEVVYAINSGSFLNIDCISRHGLRYDENVFLDEVDYEFGLEVRDKGCKVQIYEDSVLIQNLGSETIGDRQSMGESVFCSHDAMRYYNIAHNRKYVMKKHKGVLRGSLSAFARNVFMILKIMRYEKDKPEKVKAAIRGMTG